MDNDTKKPDAHDTIPEMAAVSVPLIEAGKARFALAGAILNMHRAIYELEAMSSAIARALDATVKP